MLRFATRRITAATSSSSAFSSSTAVASRLPFFTLLTPFLQTQQRHHGFEGDRSKPLKVKVELKTGEVREITVYEGQSLIDMAHDHDLPVEAACAGSIACSTCHCYLEDEAAMKKFDEPTDEEYDMLDTAYMPGPTSRLGCQLKVKQGVHDGIKFRLPQATRNMAVDGYQARHH